jgi:hypothetical protein
VLLLLPVPCFVIVSSLSYGLQDLDLSNNEGLTGFLPPQMGLLPLRSVRAAGTDLSCAGIIRPYVSAVCGAAAVWGLDADRVCVRMSCMCQRTTG